MVLIKCERTQSCIFVCTCVRFQKRNRIEKEEENKTLILTYASADSLRCYLSDSHALLSYYVSRANLRCVVATIFSSLAILFSSISMTNLSYLVATIFSSLAFLSSSVSMANLSAALFCSLALPSSSVSTANLSCSLSITFSSFRFLSNPLSSPCFNLLRVVRGLQKSTETSNRKTIY